MQKLHVVIHELQNYNDVTFDGDALKIMNVAILNSITTGTTR